MIQKSQMFHAKNIKFSLSSVIFSYNIDHVVRATLLLS